MDNNDQSSSAHISRTKLIALCAFIIIVILISFFWWDNYRKYITTDDANLSIDRVSVSTVVSGQIEKIHFKEGDSIKKGDLLFSINDTLARIRYEFSKSVYESYPGTRRQGDADYLSVLVNYEEAKYELSTYHIHSPLDGIFAKGWAVAGDVVQAGQTIVSINEYKPIWVSAFIEESKIKNIHIGQKAQISVDAYKDLKITGTIYYIADNTASEFSLVSTSNASGNFTKTSQRIQIKVSIDSVGNSKNINYKLLSGMSVSLKIRKKNN